MRSVPARRSRLRSVAAGLLATGVTVVMAAAATGTATATTGSVAPDPGGVTLSDVQITKTGLTAILTSRAAGGAKIDPASVKATVGGVTAVATVQPIAQVRRVTTLLIDTSGSMGPAGMATVVRASAAFLASAPADVYIGVVAFSTVPRVVVKPTLNRDDVRTAIAGLKSSGETSLYDGIASTLGQLGSSGDRSFTLLSDGGDTRSQRTLAQTRKALAASGVRAQVVAFKTDETQGSVLKVLASAGHGNVAAASNDAAVEAAFTLAGQTLASQVRVVITSPPSVGGRQPLVVTASAGGKALQSITSVDLAVTSPPVASVAPEPTVAVVATVAGSSLAAAKGPFGIPLMVWFAMLTVSLGLAVAIVTVATPTEKNRQKGRMDSIERYVSGSTSIRMDRNTPTVASISESLVSLGDKVMDKRNATSRTQRLLERADLPLRPGEWAVLRVVAVVVGMACGMVLLHGGQVSMIVGAGLGIMVGFIGPAIFLKFAASRRVNKFESQLPDVLTLVASSLSTGFSLLQALDAVARDAAEPSAKEFSRALAETRIGTDIDDSLAHLADRTNSTNLRWTGMAINIQRQVGGNLAETLRNTAATLRERESLRRHVKALSAEGRLSAYILIALPVGIFLYMLMVNKEYVELLWTNMIGIGMLVAGMISLVIGMFWMRKVVNVEV